MNIAAFNYVYALLFMGAGVSMTLLVGLPPPAAVIDLAAFLNYDRL